MGSQAFTETIPALRTAGKFPRRAYKHQRPDDEWASFGPIAMASTREDAKPWIRGAISERHVEGGLTRLSHAGIAVLHNRRVPGTWAPIDQIAINRSGIWVISAQRYEPQDSDTPARAGGTRTAEPEHELLFVGRRGCDDHVERVRKQVEAIRKVVGSIPVTGALCMVDSGWPLFGGSFVTRDIRVVWPEFLVSELIRSNEGRIHVKAVREHLAEYLTGA